MITVRRSEDRGLGEHGWLSSRHTFSFAGYHDPKQMGFRALRVINEDRVQGGKGFPDHGHRDMEIVSYVLEGALEHEDSMGHTMVLRPGEVQRMSAGTGVIHSEFNHSRTEPVHFLQIWILPEARGISPSYEQKAFSEDERRGVLRVVASRDGREGSLAIHQDVQIHASLLGPGDRVSHPLAKDRHAWVQVARGEIAVHGETLRAGDGAAISAEASVEIEGRQQAEILLFDLA